MFKFATMLVLSAVSVAAFAQDAEVESKEVEVSVEVSADTTADAPVASNENDNCSEAASAE